VLVNGEPIPFHMKVGEAGEAFFVLETDDDVPEEYLTSPLLEATKVCLFAIIDSVTEVLKHHFSSAAQPGEKSEPKTSRFGSKDDHQRRQQTYPTAHTTDAAKTAVNVRIPAPTSITPYLIRIHLMYLLAWTGGPILPRPRIRRTSSFARPITYLLPFCLSYTLLSLQPP